MTSSNTYGRLACIQWCNLRFTVTPSFVLRSIIFFFEQIYDTLFITLLRGLLLWETKDYYFCLQINYVK